MATPAPDILVEEIRAVSRSIARDWGFLGGDFAGTDLSPSAVHALIAIERGGLTARHLSARLRLEKSSVSRMLRKLVDGGDVQEKAGEDDARVKRLSLTAAGRRRVAAIHAHARGQVGRALARLEPTQARTVLEGLQLYAGALAVRGEPRTAPPPVDVVEGYQPGLIARITQMHALYYSRECGLGQHFESVVAAGLSGFCDRLGSRRNAVWTARRAQEVVGSVAIDGEDLGGNVAHLRWFIVDDTARGTGAGRRLLETALAFVDGQAFEETRLWTFDGLSAARHLYESVGFECMREWPGTQWGKEVKEQMFARRRP